MGEAIYKQSFYFADHNLLVSEECQNRITEYTFCKKFNCPPFPSLNQTPPNIIDDFLVIEEEYRHCIVKQKKEQTNAVT